MTALSGGTATPTRPPRAWLSRLPRVVAWLAIAVPIGISMNFVARFGVDVPYWDQWDFIPLLEHAARGDLRFSELAGQHNEHRILFPRLIMLGLARLTRWDVRAEMWAGWSMLVLTALVLHLELRQRGRPPSLTAWGTVPAAWLLLSLRQWENLLWGWQFQIVLAGLAAVVALWALLTPSPLRVGAGMGAGVVSSFSFASGLAVWPAGAVILLLAPMKARRRLVLLGAWAAAASLTLATYLHDFVRPAHHPSPRGALEHPLDALGFFGTTLGASLIGSPPLLALIVGWTLILALGLLVVWLAAEPDGLARARFGLGLVAFAVLVGALITVGRLGLDPLHWLGPAASSRYATLMVLGVYGLYRASLEVDPTLRRRVLCGALILAIAVSSAMELGAEFSTGAREARRRRDLRAAVLALPNVSDSQLQGLYPQTNVVRERVPILRALGLGPVRPPAR